MAVAEEQEMTAKVADMRAKVVEAEAEVPKAMSQAFREGNLGIMDYYSMKNIQADTGMRDSISGTSDEGPEAPSQGQQESGAFSTWGFDIRFGRPLSQLNWPGDNACLLYTSPSPRD